VEWISETLATRGPSVDGEGLQLTEGCDFVPNLLDLAG
jgi:hypothetical protein